ncbi:hypothetical protein HOLleu_26328 [Holothuria leucospilota]|uniref:Uncharacterized protein n=1 Tax=Holothuria leucospilota TaxID=206669 RepID=A0A9Q1H508_HOLLE|nr:hypothetical protein HOLleu_26328 [Holothuria leucospilota]
MSHILFVGDSNRDTIPFLETMGYRNFVDFVTNLQANFKLDVMIARGEYYKVKPAPPTSSSDHTTLNILPISTEKHRKVQPRKEKFKAGLPTDNVDILREALDTTD